MTQYEDEFKDLELGIDSRFSGAEYAPAIKQIPIATIGCGGIGSPFHLMISRMNPKMIANFEYDTVEIHNLGGQVFSMDDVGFPKADATAERLKAYSDYHEFVNFGKFEEGNQQVLPVMFLCVDNNEVRKEAVEVWRAAAEKANWVFTFEIDGEEYTFPWVMYDGRLSFNSFDCYVVTKESVEYHYANRLPISTEDVLPPNCTTKSNPEVGFLTAGFMLTLYRNWVHNQMDIHDDFPATKNVPYRFNADLSNFQFKTYAIRNSTEQ